MAETSIEWTDATWNPVAGCTILTAGCTNCYAMRMAARLQAMGVPKYAGLTRKSGDRHVWTGAVSLNVAVLDAPKAWRKPRLIFVNSMSDLFQDAVPFDFNRQTAALAMIQERASIGQSLLPRHGEVVALCSRGAGVKLSRIYPVRHRPPASSPEGCVYSEMPTSLSSVSCASGCVSAAASRAGLSRLSRWPIAPFTPPPPAYSPGRSPASRPAPPPRTRRRPVSR